MNMELVLAYISDTDWFSRYISTLKTRTEMVLETLVLRRLTI
jgi:hypothetical protein